MTVPPKTGSVIDGIAINAGQAATGYLFGELANAIISGTVYLDRDDDGDVIIGTDADGHNDLMSRITAFLAANDQ